MSQQEIADSIGSSQPTIRREQKRNAEQHGYHHKHAQKTCDEHRLNAVKAIKRQLIDLPC